MIVDSNVLIDIIVSPKAVPGRIERAFAHHSSIRQMAINHVIFAEITPRHSRQVDVERRVHQLGLILIPFSNADAYRAGAAFREYRRRGGPRDSILPDFLIGAQAATRGWPILTRDQRFESYFPEVELIDPTMVSYD